MGGIEEAGVWRSAPTMVYEWLIARNRPMWLALSSCFAAWLRMKSIQCTNWRRPSC